MSLDAVLRIRISPELRAHGSEFFCRNLINDIIAYPDPKGWPGSRQNDPVYQKPLDINKSSAQNKVSHIKR